ncbi:MAG TPA: NAD(P)-binding domain-containing protein [Thermoanaerobaculia bacterium]|nr:NAD(P)-binding domain-containing protein [Thermoanaerobaculia bacterium]
MTETTIEQTRVIIVGAGPIGIELAVALRQAGIAYIQLDAGQIGSTIAWYPPLMQFHSSAERLSLAGVAIQVPDQQKPTREEYLAYLRSVVQQFGLPIRTFERVENARRLPSGGFELSTRAVDREHRYHAEIVVLAIGAMHAPRLLGIAGEDAPHVSHYLHDPHTYFAKRLLIAGGRNSAVEAAVRCQRAGAEVTLSYRRADFDAAVVKFWLLPEIRSMIRDARVQFLPRTRPIEIGAGWVDLAPTADDGAPLAGAAPTRNAADFVLLMTGYQQNPALFEMLGVKLEGPAHQPVHDPETMETNIPGIFIAGTAVAGTPPRKVAVIVETCHVHVPRIVGAITGRRVAGLVEGREDE